MKKTESAVPPWSAATHRDGTFPRSSPTASYVAQGGWSARSSKTCGMTHPKHRKKESPAWSMGRASMGTANRQSFVLQAHTRFSGGRENASHTTTASSSVGVTLMTCCRMNNRKRICDKKTATTMKQWTSAKKELPQTYEELGGDKKNDNFRMQRTPGVPQGGVGGGNPSPLPSEPPTASVRTVSSWCMSEERHNSPPAVIFLHWGNTRQCP